MRHGDETGRRVASTEPRWGAPRREQIRLRYADGKGRDASKYQQFIISHKYNNKFKQLCVDSQARYLVGVDVGDTHGLSLGRRAFRLTARVLADYRSGSPGPRTQDC